MGVEEPQVKQRGGDAGDQLVKGAAEAQDAEEEEASFSASMAAAARLAERVRARKGGVPSSVPPRS